MSAQLRSASPSLRGADTPAILILIDAGLSSRWSRGIVERLWRSVKYEEVYLRAYETVPEARASIAGYFAFYNAPRPHSALDRRTPNEAYFGAPAMAVAA